MAKKILGIIISIITLFYSFSKLEISQFFKILGSIKYLYVLVASLTFIISICMLAFRWKIILESSKNVPLPTLIKGQFIGYFGNNIFPLRFGEFMRSYFVAKRNRLTFIEVFGTVALERFIDLFTIAILFLTLLLFGTLSFKESSKKLGFLVGIIFVVLIIIYVFQKNDRIPFFRRKIKDNIHLFLSGINSLKNKRSLTFIIIGTLIIWMCYFFKIFLIFIAFDIKTEIMTVILVVVAVVIGLSFPAAPGAIGTYHMAVIVGLHNIAGYDFTLAQSLSIILHLSSYIPVTLIGFVVFILSKANISEMKKEASK